MASSRPSRVLAFLALLLSASVGSLVLPGSASASPALSLSEVQHRVDALNHQAEQATERFDAARVALDDANRQLRSARNRLAVAQRRLDSKRTLVGRIAVASYKAGGVDTSVALLLSDDPAQFLRQASDLSQVDRRQAYLLRDMAAARLRAAVDKQAVAASQARAVALTATIATERRNVLGHLAEAQTLLGGLRADQRAKLQAMRRAALEQALAARSRASRASRSRTGDPSAATTDPAATPNPAPSASDSPSPSSSPSPSASASPKPKSGSGGSGGSGGSSTSDRAAVAVRTAYAQLGDPYVWGADGPGSFDCSGLTMYAWAAAGVSLPHSAAAQYASIKHVAISDLEPGDLVFYYSPISHVGIYIGGGRIIDAPYPGLSVHITSLHTMPLVGAGRP